MKGEKKVYLSPPNSHFLLFSFLKFCSLLYLPTLLRNPQIPTDTGTQSRDLLPGGGNRARVCRHAYLPDRRVTDGVWAFFIQNFFGAGEGANATREGQLKVLEQPASQKFCLFSSPVGTKVFAPTREPILSHPLSALECSWKPVPLLIKD